MCTLLFHIHHGVEPHALEDKSINGVSSACLSRNCSPNSVLSKDFFLYINGLRSRMRWCRIAAAVAAAAAAAFEEAGIFPLCGRNGFPMHARRFDLRFNVIRTLWTVFVIFHGRLGRFEAHIIKSLFLLAQLWKVNSPSTTYQNSFGNTLEHSMMVLVLGDNFEFFLQFSFTRLLALWLLCYDILACETS